MRHEFTAEGKETIERTRERLSLWQEWQRDREKMRRLQEEMYRAELRLVRLGGGQVGQ